MMKLAALLPTLFLVQLFVLVQVSAHGFVYIVSVDGKAFTGNIPDEHPSKASVIREVSAQDPVKGATNPSVNCGNNAQIAAQTADALPGSVLSFDWREADLANWPHNTGPMLTYMASCGSVSCSSFNSSDANWFKIDQVGLKSDGVSWYQEDLMSGMTASVMIPTTLAAGEYLVRHEIIALHLAQADTIGGAEFYPSCTQLHVGGNQTGLPDPSELVKLPGAYKDTDPGIEIDPYSIQNGEYPFPGPGVAKFAQSTANSGSGTSSPTSSGPGSLPPGKCRLKKHAASGLDITSGRVTVITLEPELA
ncbi:glycosyl hydrolase family 61-domain-containing protein [Mycena floridula]|nr:glycosyl hydrolase family 61-domain-containing protein [Mycena floridula]